MRGFDSPQHPKYKGYNMTPWIQNVSLSDIEKGFHFDAGSNSMLIQIVDPAMQFPKPKCEFKETYKFEFLDLEQNDEWGHEFKITDTQAKELVILLKYALSRNMNVIVHCVAGVCRSGAVCEIGVMLGFDDTEVFRSPNLMVKHKMMEALGWAYDVDEKPTMSEGGIIIPAKYYGGQSS